MEDNFGLPERTLNELLDYFKSNINIEKVVIYGSRAKGNYRKGSDIDFAIWITDNENSRNVYWDLEELPTPYKFDVTDYKALTHEALKNSIDKDGKIFYLKNNDK